MDTKSTMDGQRADDHTWAGSDLDNAQKWKWLHAHRPWLFLVGSLFISYYLFSREIDLVFIPYMINYIAIITYFITRFSRLKKTWNAFYFPTKKSLKKFIIYTAGIKFVIAGALCVLLFYPWMENLGLISMTFPLVITGIVLILSDFMLSITFVFRHYQAWKPPASVPATFNIELHGHTGETRANISCDEWSSSDMNAAQAWHDATFALKCIPPFFGFIFFLLGYLRSIGDFIQPPAGISIVIGISVFFLSTSFILGWWYFTRVITRFYFPSVQYLRNMLRSGSATNLLFFPLVVLWFNLPLFITIPLLYPVELALFCLSSITLVLNILAFAFLHILKTRYIRSWKTPTFIPASFNVDIVNEGVFSG